MTPKQFDKLMATRRFRGRTLDGLRLMLVDQLPLLDAAYRVGIRRETLTQALNGITEVKVCPTCGQTTGREIKLPTSTG
jgi:predicted DNA-binding protein (UPF0251 family)